MVKTKIRQQAWNTALRRVKTLRQREIKTENSCKIYKDQTPKPVGLELLVHTNHRSYRGILQISNQLCIVPKSAVYYKDCYLCSFSLSWASLSCCLLCQTFTQMMHLMSYHNTIITINYQCHSPFCRLAMHRISYGRGLLSPAATALC